MNKSCSCDKMSGKKVLNSSSKRNEMFIGNLLNQINEKLDNEEYQRALALCDNGIQKVEAFTETNMELTKKVNSLTELYNCAGVAHEKLGNTDMAKRSYEKEYKIAKDHNLTDSILRSCQSLGSLLAEKGELKEAFEYLEQKVRLCVDPLDECQSRIYIARVYFEKDRTKESMCHLRAALNLARRECDSELKCKCELMMGEFLMKDGNLSDSRTFFNQAIKTASDRGVLSELATRARVKELTDNVDGFSASEFDSNLPIDINVLGMDDDDKDLTTSQRNKEPIPIDDDDSFMPPSVADSSEASSKGSGGFAAKYDPRNRADSENGNFWQLREEDALKKNQFKRPTPK